MNVSGIRAIVLDVDGVLTDGRLYFGERGESMKVFHVHDGTAIKAWRRHGGRIAFLSGRDCPIVQRRGQDLGVDAVIQGRTEKLEPFTELLESWSLKPSQSCYVGDDTPDIAPMQACGFAVAVADAVPEVKRCAAYVTRAPGGRGAVREVIDHLLSKAR